MAILSALLAGCVLDHACIDETLHMLVHDPEISDILLEQLLDS